MIAHVRPSHVEFMAEVKSGFLAYRTERFSL